MTPVAFPECNTRFGPPAGVDESQVMTVMAYVGEIDRGSLEGATMVVTAWLPSPEELAELIQGKPLYLSFIGGLPPHYPSVSFHLATHPA